MIRRPVFTLSLLMVCLWARPALAQDPTSTDPPAHVSLVDGAAVLERDGRIDNDLASMPLLAGDRVRTQGGRVEILFTDGSALHLDANTVVDFQSDEVVRLLEGRVRLTVGRRAGQVAYRLDGPSAWVQINDPGEYRVAVLRDGEVELAVLRGSAELVNEQGRSAIRAGERTFARDGTAPSPAYVFNSASWDAFDRWSESRRDQRLGVSAQYLPEDVRRYAPAFDAHGSWRYEQVYGYVWYPRAEAGWRPYQRGRWASLRPYGWTWIAGDPWGWPTHHYGRWGVSAGSWFWIPGRNWAPAWVSWAYAPGYVSWCPLGWNDRPVLQIVNVNVYGGRRYDPWDAWTVLPRHHFGAAYVNVSRAASFRVDSRLHNSFVVDRRGPESRFAGGRDATPIRAIGRSNGAARGAGRDAVGGFRSNDARRPGEGTENVRDRGFPAAARNPGISMNPQPERGTRERGAVRDPGPAGGMRSNAREPGTTTGSAASPRAGVYSDSSRTPAASGPSREEPRGAVDEARRSRRTDLNGGGAVTAAPAGAVRAVPRTRGSADLPPSVPATRSAEPQDRERSYTPGPAAPSAPSSPGYRSGVRERSAPRPADDTPAYGGSDGRRMTGSAPARSRSMEPPPSYRPEPERQAPPPYRQEPERQAPPSYRSAPERQAPPSYRSAPERQAPPSYRPAPEHQAPAAAPSRAEPSPPSGGGERQGAGSGGGRQPSAGSRATGEAVRRQR